MKHLICPLCSESLSANAQGIGCANRHQFDRAKEGYFNLLPVQHKNSREPGDAKEQLLARRAFLQAGFFSPLLGHMIDLLPTNAQTLLDIGCGEGYFTRGLAANRNADIYGLDIAKEGIRLAARHSKLSVHGKINYIVASSYSLPIADHSMDVVTRIYAPSRDTELQRVLKPEGCLIIVTPGQRHLLKLRQYLYQELRPHPEPRPPVGFVTESQQQLNFELDIPPGDYTRALLQMTPFVWRMNPAMLEHLITAGLTDTADFNLSVYRQL